jgi:O-acetylhomoserine (thiol)-lyase
LNCAFKKACDNAFGVATYLEKHPKVKHVRFNGLPSSLFYERSKNYFSVPGSIICLELDSAEACFKLINNVNIIRRATNLHDNKSLIIHPASTIYCEFSNAEREQMDVFDTMIRLSVGIENIEDICADLEQALTYV